MDAAGDLIVRPARGVPAGLVIPAGELSERFSRASGPGGQSVNTTDSRVELSWDVARSTALGDAQRARLLADPRVEVADPAAGEVPDVVSALLVVRASEHRSQLQNRIAARARLAAIIRDALAPPPPPRRPTTPSRAARARRVEGKRRRGELKSGRRQPPAE